MIDAFDVAAARSAMAIGTRSARGPAASRREEFTALVRREDRRLRVLAFRLLDDPSEMDDVLQDAYLKAYRAYDSFEGRATQATWLYRIVYNACIDRRRELAQAAQRSAGGVLSIDWLQETGGEPAAGHDVARTVDNRSALAEALGTLPKDQRAAVLLIDAFGYDYRSAAQVLGVRRGTVASRVHRARAALRSVLTDNEEDQ
ncbi:MAG: RNA polymerase sigma factor [Coriobacteriia bacterium]